MIGSATAVASEASEAYRNSTNVAIQTSRQTPAASGARARMTPPAVATIFPPLPNPSQTGRAWPIIAAAPASTPTHSPPTLRPTNAGTKPLATSRSATGTPSQRPYARHTFEAPMLPLPCFRMSSPLKSFTTTTPNGIDPIR